MARGYLTPWSGGSPAPTGVGGFGSLFDLHRRMDRLFDDLFHQRSGDAGMATSASISAPAMDIAQDDKQIEITAELPGVKEEDVDLSIEDGVLTLSGEKKCERRDEESGYSERSYGRFERRITLPSNIDEEHCSADFRDGVLRITIPKAEGKQRGRHIPLGRRADAAKGGAAKPVTAQNDAGTRPMQQAAQENPRGGGQQR